MTDQLPSDRLSALEQEVRDQMRARREQSELEQAIRRTAADRIAAEARAGDIEMLLRRLAGATKLDLDVAQLAAACRQAILRGRFDADQIRAAHVAVERDRAAYPGEPRQHTPPRVIAAQAVEETIMRLERDHGADALPAAPDGRLEPLAAADRLQAQIDAAIDEMDDLAGPTWPDS